MFRKMFIQEPNAAKEVVVHHVKYQYVSVLHTACLLECIILLHLSASSINYTSFLLNLQTVKTNSLELTPGHLPAVRWQVGWSPEP